MGIFTSLAGSKSGQELRVDLLAENGGFEPPIELSPYNGLANRRLQPLGQLSVFCCSCCFTALAKRIIA